MSDLAQLLLPAVRWDADRGFDRAAPGVERALAMGVGGFIIFGGEAESVATLTAQMRAASRHPLLIAADLERGAGQQFTGCTGLPPYGAIASLGDAAALRAAGRLTAREALAVGINWIYAPVADLDVEADNPIVGTRSAGGDAEQVRTAVVETVEAIQGEGVLACVKHFPGLGRATSDSFAVLPVMNASREELEDDLAPFAAAVDAGVASVMIAHAGYPALDPSGTPATCSHAIVHELLRGTLGFEGLVVTDALIMSAVQGAAGEPQAAISALQAGCDLLLHPGDLVQVHRALEVAAGRSLDMSVVDAALERRARWARWVRPAGDARPPGAEEHAEASTLARRVIQLLRGPLAPLGPKLSVAVVDDDVGGPYMTPSRQPLFETLHAMGADVVRDDDVPTTSRPLVVALFGDVHRRKGRAGYSEQALARVTDLVARARNAHRDVVIVQFSHPRLMALLPEEVPVVSAWGGEAPMQRAVAQWIMQR